MNYKLLVFVFASFQLFSQKESSITINLAQEKTAISPMMYGQFIEYLGRCIDGGVYEEGSPLSDENGFRKDVLESVKALDIPIMRFPGGTVTKIYNWKDGIGDTATRPTRKNLIWGGTIDNHFGTAEFIKYCRLIGAEPFLVVNMATDSPMSAAEWVEYCNSSEDTYWANLRRSHGYEEPFNVKYWGLGNEEYAEPDAGIHQNVDDYIKDSWHFLKLMKLQDTTIKIAVVGSAEDLSWSREVVKEMHPAIDFLSVHFFSMPWDDSYKTLLKSVDMYAKSLDSLRVVLAAAPEEVTDFSRWYRFPSRQDKLTLAIDEWSIWDMKSNKGKGDYQMEYDYNWAHALVVAKFLNMFQRNADIIGFATWAQTVNVLAPIMSTPEGSYKQTIYTPLHAYRHLSKGNYLPIEAISTESKEAPKCLDVTATISDDGSQIVVAIINVSEKESNSIEFNFDNLGNGKKIQLIEQRNFTSTSLEAVSTMNKNVVIETKNTKLVDVKKKIVLEIPAASINFYEFEIQK
jgi:alpha-L-arabinofuranosidase